MFMKWQMKPNTVHPITEYSSEIKRNETGIHVTIFISSKI
jgi:hypothetical protein